MKTGKLKRCNTIHIHSTPITTKQYLQEHIKRGIEWLEGIFTQAGSVEQDGYFIHTQHTWRYMHYMITGRNTAIQQNPKADSRYIVSDGKLDCAMRSDTSQNMIIRSTQITEKCSKDSVRLDKLQTGKVGN